FTEPRWLGRHLSAGVDLYSQRLDFTRFAGYQSNSTGAGVRLGFPLGQYTSLSTRYNLHGDDVVVNASECGNPPLLSPVICGQRGSTFTSLVGYTVRLDKRNDYFNPTR